MSIETKTFPMLCETYNKISQQAYEEYTESIIYLKSLGCAYWDFLEHTEEENAKYMSAMQDRERSALTAIVFQALAIESFVNLLGVQGIGEEVYYSEYETKGSTTLEKLKKICKEFLKKPYPTNDKDYSMLTSLLKKRDLIVHTKPRTVSIDGEAISYEEFMSQTEYIHKNICEEIKSYENLKRKLAMLEGKEIDLIQENYQELIKCLSDNIIEMIFKATVGNRESDAN